MTAPVAAGLPRVSVVIPCYNYAHFLPGAVRSATEQPGVDVDVIIVDDASTDASAAVALELAAADERISVLQHGVNRGHIVTYNDGLSRAEGDYIVLLSADDELAPGSLGRAAAVFEAHPEVGLVYGFVEYFGSPDAPTPSSSRQRRSSVRPGERWVRRICRRGRNIIVNPEAVVRRSVLARIGGYDPAMPQTGDMDLWLRAAAVSAVGRVNGPVQGRYRVHGGNMHLTDHAGHLVELRARRHTFERFFAEQGAALADAAGMLGIARRALAREALLAAIRQASGGELARAAGAELAGFAAETWPPITRSLAWRRLLRRTARPAPALLARVEAAADRIRLSLQWRRWRRYGT
ncbi:glycosyltransferase [Microbacteriaceae bacterium VKM Ac-2854]|nr:glycosyltransferase [Microbacteriaceae bacterium VKM Ac-2854]